MDDGKWSADIIPEVKPDEKMLDETGERMRIKPCDMISQSSAGESMFIKPCHTISKRSIWETMFLKPCDTLSNSLTKKRCVDSVEVDKMDWDEEVVELPPIKIEEGQHLDVKAFLSSKDRDYLVSPTDDAVVPISSLDGKYVIVCGLSVPGPHVSCDCQALQDLYSELSLRGIADDVKFVVVVKLAPGFTEADLNTLVSRLPVNGLAVPLSDPRSLHYLCDSLLYFPDDPQVVELPHLAINPSGIVLQHCPYFLRKYGSLSFPFTREHFNIIDIEDKFKKHELYFSYEPRTIELLFGCSDLTEIGNEMNFKSSDELRCAPVGLYLYFDGKFMDKLQDVQRKCVDKGLKFEIVLLPLPFHDECDPASFYKLMKQHALKYSTSSSWLACPFNDKICRAFWRMFMCREDDQLIILQHDKYPGELFGKLVASCYGVDAYPFSRSVVVERKLSELRSITVESLFVESEVHIPPKKNVLLQIDFPTNDSAPGLKCPPEKYTELQVKYPDIKEYFLPLMTDETSGQTVPAPDSEYVYVCSRIFMKGSDVEEPVRPLLVVFGNDGKIVSRHEGKLRGSTTPANLFKDTLRAEILAEIKKQVECEA